VVMDEVGLSQGKKINVVGNDIRRSDDHWNKREV